MWAPDRGGLARRRVRGQDGSGGVGGERDATTAGIWLCHCHVDDHMDEGMLTRYQVR
ncbi:multicopper oxidase domain-containing protein [Streptomyces sp. NPDC056672]|uniref:multicopper oxidase domain-containing protein n=1 Tax=Streptomyces sp. NPDC056672 TaxID=3345906 RepID=UPI0036C18173